MIDIWMSAGLGLHRGLPCCMVLYFIMVLFVCYGV